MSIKIYVENGCVFFEKGMFSKKYVSVPIRKHEGIEINQNLFGQWLNYGNFKVTTGGVSINYKIGNPHELQNQILLNK